ncbi:glycerophosphodiester phosphodiesterase [Spongiactinospora rosea]|uniref:glycerophosphodiester phosphodiesterase n=1 Tax=Spongiactinospora rosea TaxID=2248750 RepID=UPI001CED8E9F|nr:glycerophosphodiester phosphodiesterase family protein [Spongiactinospora rosea]
MFRLFRRLVLVSTTTLATLTAVTVPATAATSVVTVAHRGASAYAPENTIAAFALAQEQRADMFELDVRETKDHALVLVHDATLARTTDAERVFPGRSPWAVQDFTLAEIRRLDAGSWFSGDYAKERVPTLGEALSAMDGSGLGLLLEIKEPGRYPGIESRVARELRRHGAWPNSGRVIVQSFDWDSMRRFHGLLPGVPVALLGTPATGRLGALARYADLVNVPYGDLTRDYVRRAHARSLKVFAWTVDDPAAIRRMISYKVDGIVTNKPDLL